MILAGPRRSFPMGITVEALERERLRGVWKIILAAQESIGYNRVIETGNANACGTCSHFDVYGKMNKIVHIRQSGNERRRIIQ